MGQEGTRPSLGSLLREGPEPPHKGAPEETKVTAQQFIDQTRRQEHSEGGACTIRPGQGHLAP